MQTLKNNFGNQENLFETGETGYNYENKMFSPQKRN